MSKIKIVLALVILSARLQAQTTLSNDPKNSTADKINSYLISAVEAYKFNGVALIAKGGKVIFHKAFGWRNFETHSYNDTITVFPILSITKSFTAMVILKLQEQKKLDLSGYPGFVSEFIYYPRDDVTIILLKNAGSYGEDLWPVTMGLSNILFGMPYDLWKIITEIKLPDNKLREKEGKYAAGKLTVTFIVKDSQLYEVLSNGMELALFAESEDAFYLQNFNTSLQFKKNIDGTIEKVIIHEHGKDIELKKVQ